MAEGVAHIIMAETLPDSGQGCYAHFHHKATAQASWTFCDIRAVIGLHLDVWLDEIDTWHGELSRRAASRTPWWWLTLGSRMTVWGPVDCKPLLFALGVIEVCKASRPERLYLLECPDEVAEYLEEWSQRSGSSVVLTREGPIRLVGAWRGHVRGMIGALRAVASLVVRMARRGPASLPTGPADVIVSSWAWSALNLEQVGDHFFGRGLDGSNGPLKGRVAWLYALTQVSEGQRVRRYCESIGRPVMFVPELLRWADVPAIFRECASLAWTLRTLKREAPDLTVGSLHSRRFVRRFWETFVAWQWPVGEFAMRRAMTRYIAAVRATSVIYPYEEKGTERSILAACRAQEPPVRAVAFAHAAYNNGHRYIRRTHAAGRPAPDALATTGPAAEAWLVASAALPPSQVATIGSPRFAESADAPDRSVGGRRVLFLVGFGFEIGLLVRFVERLPNLFEGYDLTIRRSPHSWQAEQDRWLDELSRLGVRFTVDAGALSSQIANANLVLFSSTSAGLEAMLHGRATIYVALHDVVDSDPFQGRITHPAIVTCRTPGVLRDTLSAFVALNPQQYEALVKAQRDFAATVYAPFDADALARLLASSAGSDAVHFLNAPKRASFTPASGV